MQEAETLILRRLCETGRGAEESDERTTKSSLNKRTIVDSPLLRAVHWNAMSRGNPESGKPWTVPLGGQAHIRPESHTVAKRTPAAVPAARCHSYLMTARVYSESRHRRRRAR